MKKLILLFSMAIVLFACEKYEEYEVETVGFTTVYFPTQEFALGRSAISGEGLEIKIGAYLGGVRENTSDRSVKFAVVDTLLNSTAYTLLPADYYTLSSSDEIIIPKDAFLGMVTVTFDSLKMAADPLITGLNYAIPLKITSASTDSIHATKDYTIVPVKMINTWEGNFYQVGQVKKFFTIKPVLDDAYVIGDTLNYPASPLRALKTLGMNTVIVDAVGEFNSPGYQLELTINSDNSVSISRGTYTDSEGAVLDGIIDVKPLKASTWDPVHRIFNLSYKFNYQDRNYEVTEKLIFRNRMRDGINEWRWAGFPGN